MNLSKYPALNNEYKDTTLSNQVADALCEYIIDKELGPNSKIPNEMELCKIFNVGRTTLREAIKTLVSRNILEIRRGVGTFVSEDTGIAPDPLGFTFINNKYKLAVDLWELRSIVEPDIAAISALRADEASIKELNLIMRKIKKNTTSSKDIGKLDMEFHRKIAESSKNIAIEHIIPIITQSSIINFEIDTSHTYNEMERAHQKIYEAIRTHDSDKAKKEMKKHLDNTLNKICNSYKYKNICENL